MAVATAGLYCLPALADGMNKSGSIKDAPAPAAQAPWQGPYIGVHAGYGFSKFGGSYDEVGDLARNLQDPRLSGFVGGVQAGWNWRSGGWVYGIEGDYSGSGQKYSFIDDDGDTQNGKIRSLASLRGRLGIASGPALVYVTGGIAHGSASFEAIESPADFGKRTISATGAVVGGGVEWMLTSNISLRGEYLRYFFNKSADITNLTGDSDADDRWTFRDNSVMRVGLNVMLGGHGGQAAAAGPARNWAGHYIGLHGGYGFTKFGGSYAEFDDMSRNLQDPNVSGAVGGAQIGFNRQSGALVYGLEADFSAAGQKFDFIGDNGDRQTGKITQLASLRARLGMANERALVFVTAGLGHGRASFQADAGGGDVGKRTLSAFGFVVGAGLEYALTETISLRGEYLHYNFNKSKNILNLTGSSSAEDRWELRDDNVFRVGINYRFSAR